MKVFLVVSDLHLSGQQKENRFSYDKELQHVFKQILFLIEKYRKQNAKVYIIFLGDLFDRSYKTPAKYGIDSSIFYFLKEKVDGMFVTIGNHELNFYINNPFWTCVNSIDSVKLNRILTKNTQPLGYINLFTVVDSLEVYDSIFHFNHFSCEDSIPISEKVNFGFYHKPFYSKELQKDAEMRQVPSIFLDSSAANIDTVLKYDYVFLGHMHWLYGIWKHEYTTIYGLASLGRPHKDEVSDTFLERNIPAIIFKNERFTNIENNFFHVFSREQSVICEIDEKQKEAYSVKKTIQRAKQYISYSDNPIENIKTFIASEPRLLALFEKLIQNVEDDQEVIGSILDIERRFYQ